MRTRLKGIMNQISIFHTSTDMLRMEQNKVQGGQQTSFRRLKTCYPYCPGKIEVDHHKVINMRPKSCRFDVKSTDDRSSGCAPALPVLAAQPTSSEPSAQSCLPSQRSEARTQLTPPGPEAPLDLHLQGERNITRGRHLTVSFLSRTSGIEISLISSGVLRLRTLCRYGSAALA